MNQAVDTSKLIGKLKDLEKVDITKALSQACIVIENQARKNAPVGKTEFGGTGNLRRSITHEIEGNIGFVGTNLFYSPYVEQGTGEYATDGNGREGYWVYVDDGSESPKGDRSKVYTLEEAKQACAILRSKGLDAFYTSGQRPTHFLSNAFNEKEKEAIKRFSTVLEQEIERKAK